MATTTFQLGAFLGNTVIVSIDYDTVTLRVSAVRVVNGGTNPFTVQAIRSSDGLLYGQDFPTGSTFIAIPTNAANTRLTLTADPATTPRFGGVTFRFG